MPYFSKRLYALIATGLAVAVVVARADDWPQWLGPQRDGVWREAGLLEKFPPDGPRMRWRTPIGSGYAGPAVANGRVLVMDRRLAPGATRPNDPFAKTTIPGTERVLCLDAANGKVLWEHEYECPYSVSYPAGPRATPTVHEGKVYTLGAEGNLFCFESSSGKVLWSRDFKKDYGAKTPLWGFAAHPLIDGKKLICLVGGEGSVALALDKDTGNELWRSLSAKEPGYCPPMIYEFNGKRELIIWHPEAVNALDPRTGKVYWSHKVEARSGLSIPTPRKAGDRLFITSFYNGSLMLRVDSDTPSVVWQSTKVSEKDTDGLHSIMPTPFVVDGYIYGVCSYGQFRCLKADTGDRLWETFEPTTGKSERWGNAFITKNGDRYFLFNEKGDLIIAKLTPEKYEEVSRAHLLEPTNSDPGRPVVWSHPAYAGRCGYARNDKEIICVSLAR